MDPDADVGADVPLDAAVPPLPFVGGGVSSPPIPSRPVAFPLPPVVLRVLPLQQSSAPVGFIYDASPDPVDGGLVAAASAFFSHQGHKVFHDPCPDLEAYCRLMGVPPLTVVNIDRLPDYLLTSGVEILASWAAPSPTGAALAGTAFMAAYLSPSSSGVGTSRPLGPSSSSARPMGGLSSLSASTSAPPPSLCLGRVWCSRGSAWRSSSRGSSSFGIWRSGGSTWFVPTPPPSLHFDFHRGLGSNVPYPCPQSVCRLVPISSHGSWGVLWGVSASSSCHDSSCLRPCSGSAARS
jgi:hypothetical protein